MKINYAELGKRVKNKRTAHGLTQAQLAEMCDISNVYVSHIENGSARISLEVLYAISNCLNSTPDFFLMDSLYTSQEYITDEIAALLKGCMNEDLHLVRRLIRAAVNC